MFQYVPVGIPSGVNKYTLLHSINYIISRPDCNNTVKNNAIIHIFRAQRFIES